MSNVSEKFGLRPYRKLDGTPLVGAQNRYTIASGYASAVTAGKEDLYNIKAENF